MEGTVALQPGETPLFTVNDQKGFYHCFSSGKHGDIFGFVMETEGLSFPEAVEKLAGDAGLPMPKPDPLFERTAKERLGLYDALEAACAHFEEQLGTREGRGALAYAEWRGLTSATIKDFGVGLAPTRRTRSKATHRTSNSAGPPGSRASGEARRRSCALRSLPPPAHQSRSSMRARPHRRLRRPRARCRDRAEISELSRDELPVRQGLDRVQLCPRGDPPSTRAS